MAEVPDDYHDVPDTDRKKAKVFFDRGTAVAATANYDYAIEMYLSGLGLDPEAVEAHKTLRDISLKRKASGGKALGMIARMKLGKGKDDKQSLLNAEKLLAYDPGSTEHMASMVKCAVGGGFFDTVLWAGDVLTKALRSADKGDFNKWVLLKNAYKAVGHYKPASEAAAEALQLKPDDQDLQHEMKNLAAQETMQKGKYGAGGNFRDSVRDREGQEMLMERDRDVRTEEGMSRILADAEAAYKAEPDEAGKVMKLVEILAKTETPANERRAIDLLEEQYKRSGTFRFRMAETQIVVRQFERRDREMRGKVAKNPGDEALRDQYRAFRRERAEKELDEYQLAAENYPTDQAVKFQVAQRMFLLERYDEAIPMLQQAVQDPKNRTDATILLGQSFLAAGFNDEAADTLKGQIDAYQLRDKKYQEMNYWYGRSLEAQGDPASAIKAYSTVAQIDFNFRDVQARLKKLRAAAAPAKAE